MITARMIAALTLATGGALALSGCQGGGAAATEAQRLAEALDRVPGVVRVDSEHTEAKVGYSSEVRLVAKVRSDGAADTIPKVLSAWHEAEPKWNAEFVIALNGDQCRLHSDSARAAAGEDRTARFFVSLCEAFPNSDVRIDLDPGTGQGPELTLDVSGDGIGHADAGLANRIRALEGADAPVSHWFLAGSEDQGRFVDYAGRN